MRLVNQWLSTKREGLTREARPMDVVRVSIAFSHTVGVCVGTTMYGFQLSTVKEGVSRTKALLLVIKVQKQLYYPVCLHCTTWGITMLSCLEKSVYMRHPCTVT